MDRRKGSKTRLYPSSRRKKRTGKNLREWREQKNRGFVEEISSDKPPEVPLTSSDRRLKDAVLIGRRIIDVGYFFNRLREIDSHGPLNCSLADMTIISEVKEGSRIGIELKCSRCFITEIVWNEDPVSNIMTNGGGHSDIEDVKPMNLFTFQKDHTLISAELEETAETEIRNPAMKEKRLVVEDSEAVADGPCAKTPCRTNYSSLSRVSPGTASKEEEKKDHPIPLEPAIVIKEEPIDYDEPTPSTSTATANDEFILPHQENTWAPPAPVVEPQLTFSVASLAPSNDPETPDAELARKKRKIQAATFVPTTNGPDVRPQSPVENFGDSSNPGSTKESRKDQFDAFGEYIAAKLRSLDRKSCAYAQKAIGDIIFEAEMGKFLNEDSDSQDLRNCVS